MIKSVIPNAAVKRMPFILTALAGLFVLTCLPVAKGQQNGAVSSQARWVADIPLEEILHIAFGSHHVIDDLDHPAIHTLRGHT